MGTRSLTFVYDENGNAIINMYRQYDGYVSGHGRELTDFLLSFDAIVNGLPVGDTRKLANGMGDVAAQLVAHFKTGSGGFYLHNIMENDCGQEYEYHIHEDKVVVTDPGEVIFSGTWQEFGRFAYQLDKAGA